jgi:DNA-binding response OmpR family regulator
MKKILFVEDDSNIRSLVKMELQEKGYDVLTADNGKDALDMLGNGMIPNLVILDIRMPKMDGLETIGNMLKLKHGVPVIIYTGYKSYRKDYLSSAADAYIIKGPDLTELVDKVHELTR